VVSPKQGCAVSSATSLADVQAGRVAPLAGAGAHLFTIKDSLVQPGSDGYVALDVTGAPAQPLWLRLASGDHACVFSAPQHVDQLAALARTRTVFAPWKPECSQLVATGIAPAAVLTAGEGGNFFEVAGFELGANGAADFVANKPGGTAWIALGAGNLKIREDSFKSCFARPEDPMARRPPGLEPLVRTAEGRCTKSDDRGKVHLECRTSLGVWEGPMTNDALELALVRRTLGPVHFLDGRPVNGTRYARAVVAVTQGEAKDSRGQALYTAMDRAVMNAVARDSGGDVRVARPNARDVTYRVHVEVSELVIGELTTREVTETTEYKAGEDVRPNPKKPEARQAVETAAQNVEDEERDYQQAVAVFEEAKRVALEQCQNQVNSMQDGTNKQWAQTGCNVAEIAAGVVQPSESGVREARSALAEAESTLAQTPDTITVPIMKDWNYTKRIYGRSTRAVLALSMKAEDAPQPVVKRINLAHEWSDYEVQADHAHNVKGHSPDRGPIQNAEALVPFVADQASKRLAAELRSAISEATIERAVKAFRAAGNAPAQPGFEAVDAMAFDTAGRRLKRVEYRDRAQLGRGGSFTLPAGVAQLAPGECLLGVAVAADAAPLDLALYTPDRRIADFRGGRAAVVEVCQSQQVTAAVVESMLLESKSGGEARWGLYRTADR
jgi:hypothetical protein